MKQLEELAYECFVEIAMTFSLNGGEVLLKREDNWEVENSNQNVFRGLSEQMQGVKNGDIFLSQEYKNGKSLKVITAKTFGNSAEWTLITAEDKDDVSYGI